MEGKKTADDSSNDKGEKKDMGPQNFQDDNWSNVSTNDPLESAGTSYASVPDSKQVPPVYGRGDINTICKSTTIHCHLP